MRVLHQKACGFSPILWSFPFLFLFFLNQDIQGSPFYHGVSFFFSFFLSLEGLIPKGTWGFSFSIEFFPLFFFSKSPRFYTRRRAAFLPFYGVFPLSFLFFPPSTFTLISLESIRRWLPRFYTLVFAHLSNLFSSSVARRDVSAC